MRKKLLIYGFVILMAGVVLLIVSLSQQSSLNGIAGLELEYTNYSLFRMETVAYSLMEGWGIGALIAGAVMLFLSVYPFTSTTDVNKLKKYGKIALVGATIVGIAFSGISIYPVIPSLHPPMKVALTENSNCYNPAYNNYQSTSNVTVTYSVSVTGGEGPFNFTWYITPQSYFVGYSSQGQYSSQLVVIYCTNQMNPNNVFSLPSPENFTVQVTVFDQFANVTTVSTVTEVAY